jgi:predicted transcriptional regulator
MFDITKAVSDHIKKSGIQISAIQAGTGIPKTALYNSLSGTRKLRADEYIAVCKFIGKNPLDFVPQDSGTPTST